MLNYRDAKTIEAASAQSLASHHTIAMKIEIAKGHAGCCRILHLYGFDIGFFRNRWFNHELRKILGNKIITLSPNHFQTSRIPLRKSCKRMFASIFTRIMEESLSTKKEFPSRKQQNIRFPKKILSRIHLIGSPSRILAMQATQRIVRSCCLRADISRVTVKPAVRGSRANTWGTVCIRMTRNTNEIAEYTSVQNAMLVFCPQMGYLLPKR